MVFHHIANATKLFPYLRGKRIFLERYKWKSIPFSSSWYHTESLCLSGFCGVRYLFSVASQS